MNYTFKGCSALKREGLLVFVLFFWGYVRSLDMECAVDGECDVDDDCGLYLAESTIPNAGLGIFLGADLAKHSLVDESTDILVVDIEANRQLYEYLVNETLPRWALGDSTWEYVPKHEADAAAIVSPGIGSIANAHLGWFNVEKTPCARYVDVPRTDPKVGAQSPFRDCGFRLTKNLKAGSELFFSPTARHFADSPLSADLRYDPIFKETWDIISYGLDDILAARLWESATKQEAEEPTDDEISNQDTKRSLGWLKGNAICIDQVRINAKQETPMDQGLFAKRNFSANSVVTTSPVRLLSRSHLDVTIVDKNSKPQKEVMWKGSQLILNSCYGDPSSSLLIFPLDSRVQAINHPSDGQIANVAIRWSSSLRPRKEWFNMTPMELLVEAKADVLAFEFYALADIAAGDELLLDRGDVWKTAWQDHVRRWSPGRIVHSMDYLAAHDYFVQCVDRIEMGNDHSCMIDVPSWIDVRCSAEILGRKSSKLFNVEQTVSCTVLNIDSSGLYSVEVRQGDTAEVEEVLVVDGVPPDTILFADLPYTANHFLRSSFRQEIGLPNGMIPEAWRDLRGDPNSECGLYMAESAIPNSGLGMFTAKEIPKDSRIFYGDVVVQVEDTHLNRKLRYRSHGVRNVKEPDWLLHNYYWDPNNAMAEFDAREVETIIPGLGMLANSHTGLVNAQHKSPRRFADLHRSLDPGTGASSTYHDVHFDALSTIEAGAELYVGYGDDWFADRIALGEIPLSYDFEVADKAVKILSGVTAKISEDSMKSTLIVDALELFKKVALPHQRLVNAFPINLTVYEEALKRGTAVLTVPNRVRSKEWLQANGGCLDNIRPGISTIKQAGRGAFATRNIKKGQVVAPMPVVHIRRHHMEIYDSEDYRDFNAETWRDGTQQLINYCYSHPESSLLLYPYSPVVNYINHSFKDPNAELRWSNFPNHQRSWLDRTPNDLDQEHHAGLIMELVATREIGEGEEVLINYGSYWEEAWNHFAKTWRPHPEDTTYASSALLNQELTWLRLSNETSDYPFVNAPAMFTGCFVKLSERAKGPREQLPIYNWKGADDLFDTGDYLKVCEIIEIEKHPDFQTHEMFDRQSSIKPVDVKYTVILHLNPDRQAKVINVPRKAIMFFDEMYMSDNFFRQSFRHEMHLPDHMVPDAWKDMR